MYFHSYARQNFILIVWEIAPWQCRRATLARHGASLPLCAPSHARGIAMTEAEFSEVVRQRVSWSFTLTAEVWMRHWSGAACRIDYVGKPLEPIGNSGDLYGFEIKTDPRSFKDTSGAFKQCIDYMHSTISDERFQQGDRLKHVFLVTPSPWNGEPNGYGRWGDESTYNGGALRLAGKFGVGIASIHGYAGLSLYVGGCKLWSERDGARSDIQTWYKSEKVGNQG